MAHELEARMIVQVIDVALGAGEQVVDAQHLVPLFEQTINQMRAEKPCSTCHKNPFARLNVPHSCTSSYWFGSWQGHHSLPAHASKKGLLTNPLNRMAISHA
jgi:hypothetical protein